MKSLLALISLLAMVAPSHGTFLLRWRRLFRGPCVFLERTLSPDYTCKCERDGIFGYEATCNSGESFSSVFVDVVSSGDGRKGTYTECFYKGGDKTTGTETACVTYKFENTGPIRRLLFGPYYGEATCTQTLKGTPSCDNCQMDSLFDSWPDFSGGCPE